MPASRREEIHLTGPFGYGIGAGDPVMSEDGSLVPSIILGLQDEDDSIRVYAVMTEDAALDLCTKVQEHVHQQRSRLVVPGRG